MISALVAGSAAFPCPLWCPVCVVPDTIPAPLPPLLYLPFASGCAVLYCIQHHRNLSVCPLLGLGHKEALGVWGQAAVI